MSSDSTSESRFNWPRGAGVLARSVLRGQGIVPAFMQTLVTQVLVLLLNIATGVLTARMLGPQGRGMFAALTFWPQCLASMMLLGLQNALVFQIRRAPLMANQFVTAGLALAGVLACFGAAIGVVAIPLVMDRQYSAAFVTTAAITAAVMTVVNLMTMLLRQIFTVSGRNGTANNSAWANPLLFLALLVAGSVGMPATPILAASCQFSAAILVLAWMARELGRTFRPDFGGFIAQIKALVSYATRGAPGDLSSTVAANIDRLALIPSIPAAQLGLYAVAFSLSRLIVVLQAALVPVTLPAMAGRSLEEAKALHDRLFRFTLYALLLIVAVVLVGGGRALQLCYGDVFTPAGPLFKVLVVEAAVGCLSFLVSQLYMTLERPGFLSFLQIASFAVTLSGLAFLIPAFGARGAALSMLLSATFRLASLLTGLPLVLRVRLPNPLPQAGDLQRIIGGLRG